MGFSSRKEPLYRKVNTCTRMVHHNSGGDYRHDRNTKAELNSEEIHRPMHAKVQRGLDYTPLFRFLLSKVGKDWTQVQSEAVSRLDKTEPLYWMVALNEDDKEDYVRLGENSYYSGLYVDENNLLQKVNPDFKPESVYVGCTCCTHTFNGNVVSVKKASAFSS